MGNENEKNPKQCDVCNWVGDDVNEFLTNSGKKSFCQSCVVVLNLGVDNLAEAHPGILVPLIRSCVAQSVSVIMGHFIEGMLQVLQACVDNGVLVQQQAAVLGLMMNKLSKDPN
jgi:hypothetical protein